MRRRNIIFGCVLVVIVAGCGRGNTPPAADVATDSPATQPAVSEWAAHLGREVTVVGRAEDAKAGARLDSAHAPPIWLDEADAWPEDLNGKLVRVTGTVVERHDLPVFIQEPEGPPRAGISVPPGTDLHEAGRQHKLAAYRIQRVRHDGTSN